MIAQALAELPREEWDPATLRVVSAMAVARGLII